MAGRAVLSETPISGRRNVVMYVFTFLGIAATLATMLLAYVVFVRALPLYNYLKEGDENGTRLRGGPIHQADPELGFAPIPGAQALKVMPPGPDIPIRIDQDGFRVPVSGQKGSSAVGDHRPIILTLGCSYTFGAATLAEKTYPYLVGQLLEGTTKNAGVSGAGLSQMLLLARRLVPSIKPDYLIVQYSPWLAERARDPFAPTYFGKIPQPYFYGEAEPALHRPVFRANILDLPFERYQTTSKSVMDFISFLANAALPLAIHDGTNMLLFYIKRLFGVVPAPTKDPAQVERRVYHQIAEIGKASGAKLIMIVLGVAADQVKIPANMDPEYVIVDANATLISRLPNPDRQHWIRQYAHWRGDPPRAVDFHPNAEAHRLIAEEIVSKIKAVTVDPQY